MIKLFQLIKLFKSKQKPKTVSCPYCQYRYAAIRKLPPSNSDNVYCEICDKYYPECFGYGNHEQCCALCEYEMGRCMSHKGDINNWEIIPYFEWKGALI